MNALLQKIKADLTKKDQIRKDSHESMRKATSLSKRAILLIHQKKFNEADKTLSEAKQIIADLQALAGTCPEIVYGGMFSAALQEYSEANIFQNLVKKRVFITPDDISVPAVDYVLGLADTVGALRRLSLDALREGDVKKGEAALETMDEIFIELLGLDEAYMLVPGLRHKSDLARRIIETTRGDITQEVRRKSLEEYLKKFVTPRVRKLQARKC